MLELLVKYEMAIMIGGLAGAAIVTILIAYGFAIFSQELQRTLDCAIACQTSERGRHPKMSEQELFYFCFQKCQADLEGAGKSRPLARWMLKRVMRSAATRASA